MPEANRLTCEEFQRRLCELLASDEPIEEHSHYQTCMICRHLVRNFEAMIESTLGEHFGSSDGSEPTPTDDWPEAT